MSKKMIADCLNYPGYADELAIGTNKCLLNLLNDGMIEIYWDNRENEMYISLPDEELLKLANEKTQ